MTEWLAPLICHLRTIEQIAKACQTPLPWMWQHMEVIYSITIGHLQGLGQHGKELPQSLEWINDMLPLTVAEEHFFLHAVELITHAPQPIIHYWAGKTIPMNLLCIIWQNFISQYPNPPPALLTAPPTPPPMSTAPDSNTFAGPPPTRHDEGLLPQGRAMVTQPACSTGPIELSSSTLRLHSLWMPQNPALVSPSRYREAHANHQPQRKLAEAVTLRVEELPVGMCGVSVLDKTYSLRGSPACSDKESEESDQWAPHVLPNLSPMPRLRPRCQLPTLQRAPGAQPTAIQLAAPRMSDPITMAQCMLTHAAVEGATAPSSMSCTAVPAQSSQVTAPTARPAQVTTPVARPPTSDICRSSHLPPPPVVVIPITMGAPHKCIEINPLTHTPTATYAEVWHADDLCAPCRQDQISCWWDACGHTCQRCARARAKCPLAFKNDVPNLPLCLDTKDSYPATTSTYLGITGATPGLVILMGWPLYGPDLTTCGELPEALDPEIHHPDVCTKKEHGDMHRACTRTPSIYNDAPLSAPPSSASGPIKTSQTQSTISPSPSAKALGKCRAVNVSNEEGKVENVLGPTVE
ncbi:uncharacterized protein LAESUDRAFT_715791 [Laetiporus sulphureus 93-53]|uniref:Uncharacterized protein n=1 Tax=Laetiporus sulphureus 93-53 TaxID=1314785 RepID=A0A165D317_9APHY|nr:uncharacterized protein LAESUDRAFT_715791 [Laetiporus sulphureus 93-53]KZT04059.1 hypothetical protein LAESUDRAFT_715791 [Laetiporus sulphureus 93-53]